MTSPSPAYGIANYLHELGRGILYTDLFPGGMPDSPDACIAVIAYGGFPSDKAAGQAVAIERPFVQVSVRDVTASGADSTAYTLYKDLEALKNETIVGTEYFQAEPQQPPFKMREDDQERQVYGFNVYIEKRQ